MNAHLLDIKKPVTGQHDVKINESMNHSKEINEMFRKENI